MADNYDNYTHDELVRMLRERDRKPRFGLVWERDEIEHDRAVNDDFVALDFDPALSCGGAPFRNLIIEDIQDAQVWLALQLIHLESFQPYAADKRVQTAEFDHGLIATAPRSTPTHRRNLRNWRWTMPK